MFKIFNPFKYKFFILTILILSILFIGWISINYTIGNDKFSTLKSILPDKYKVLIKKYFFADKFNKDLIENYENKENDFIEKILNSEITFNKKSTLDLSKIRKKIVSDHILDDEQILIEYPKKKDEFLQKHFPELANDFNETQYEIISSKYYEMKSNALLLKRECTVKDKDKELIILIGGHGGVKNLLNELDPELFDKKLNECNDFLILDMSITGMNSINWLDDNMKKKRLKNNTFFPGYKFKTSMRQHKVFAQFQDNEYSNKKPLSLMLSGNYSIINKVIDEKNYNRVSIIGKSGGAWEALLQSSIIPKIEKSICFAGGTMPLIYRIDDDFRHYEDMEKNFFSGISYIDLYLLSIYDENFSINRKTYHIFNLTDPCCYSGKRFFKHFDKSFQAKNFYLKSFKSDKHEINNKILIKILNEK